MNAIQNQTQPPPFFIPVSTAGTMSVLALVASLICIVGACLWFSKRKENPSGLPYPPGPRGLPLIGSVLDIDKKQPYLTHADWGKTYGDIVYCRLLSYDCIIINSETTAKALAEKRSAIYSDRPYSPLFETFGIHSLTPSLEYGNLWQMHRKLYHQTFRLVALEKYQQLFLERAHTLVDDLRRARDTHHGIKCLAAYAASITLEVTYGYKPNGLKDPLSLLGQEILAKMYEGMSLERASISTILPIPKYLPSWVQGLAFKSAMFCREGITYLTEHPFATARRLLHSGDLPPCMIYDILSKHGTNLEVETALKTAASTVFFAGEESTTACLMTFILAMVLYPDAQAKAQAEIDAVVGRNRSPTSEDRPHLPYVQAVIYEVLRWYPAVPQALPHRTTRSDVYNGYYIPKGSLVIFNTWALSRNCSDPHRFDPERHLSSDGQLLPQAKQNITYVFGYGRRICPGRHLVDNLLFAACAFMLWGLRFEKAKDQSGRDVEFEPNFTSGTVCYPKPFPCSIVRRPEVGF